MTTIFFEKGFFLYEATVIGQTEKAYQCSLKSFALSTNDKIGSIRKNIWLPKSVCLPKIGNDILEVKKSFIQNIKC
jgi:hypothetical protein